MQAAAISRLEVSNYIFLNTDLSRLYANKRPRPAEADRQLASMLQVVSHLSSLTKFSALFSRSKSDILEKSDAETKAIVRFLSYIIEKNDLSKLKPTRKFRPLTNFGNRKWLETWRRLIIEMFKKFTAQLTKLTQRGVASQFVIIRRRFVISMRWLLPSNRVT